MVWAAVFFVFFIVFFTGRSRNDNIALLWKRACTEVISTNFAHFGVAKEPSTSME